jgi:hypothetical protein
MRQLAVRSLVRFLAPCVALLAVLAVPGAGAGQLHLTDADALATGTTATATGSAYSFEALVQGKPVRWNPCAPIHWRYRRSGQVVGGFTQVVRAIARISRVTGTTWVYDGAVTTAPTTAWLPKTTATRPPLLIGWTTAAHSDLLQGQSPGVLGVTRLAWFGVTRNGVTTSAIRSAVVALNQSKRLPLTGSVSWYTVVLHELSHAMGLGHAGSARQIMYPVIQRGLTDLQSGDRTGLAKVGRSQGCINL